MSMSGPLPPDSRNVLAGPTPDFSEPTAELPPLSKPPGQSLADYLASGKSDPYLDFTLKGLLPRGPFDPSVPQNQSKTITQLATRLLADGEYGAVHFLLSRCGPLRHLELQLPTENAGEALSELGGILQQVQPQIASLRLGGALRLQGSDPADNPARALAGCHHLEEIFLSQPGDSAARCLFNALAQHPSLKKLSIGSLVIKHRETAEAFAAMLESLPGLSSLTMKLDARPSLESLIMGVLSRPPVLDRLQSLALHCDALKSSDNLDHLRKLIANSSALTAIHLDARRLTPPMAAKLPAVLSQSVFSSKSLTSVTLRGDVARQCGKSFIAAASSVQGKIVEFDLDLPSLHPPQALEKLAGLLEQRDDIVTAFGSADAGEWASLIDEDIDDIHESYRSEDSDVSDEEPDLAPGSGEDNISRYKQAVQRIGRLLESNRSRLVGKYGQVFVEYKPDRVGPAHLDPDTGGKVTEKIFNYSTDIAEFRQVMHEVNLAVNSLPPLPNPPPKKTD